MSLLFHTLTQFFGIHLNNEKKTPILILSKHRYVIDLSILQISQCGYGWRPTQASKQVA